MRKIFNRLIPVIIVLSILTAVGSYFHQQQKNAVNFESLVIKTAKGESYNFIIEIAKTREERAKGLMFRKSLEDDHGMLFKMGSFKVQHFWMKDTFIPLDIIFITPEGKIKKIHKNAKPESLNDISSDVPVSAVLEINGGLSSKLGISKGDRVIH